MSRVPVTKAVLEWAISRRGRPAKLREKFPKLDSWLRGEEQPTFKQLQDFARATSTALGYFFLSSPPLEEAPINHYRSVDDKAPVKLSPELLDTIRIMQKRQDFIRDYLLEVGAEKINFVASFEPGANPVLVARKIRDALGLQPGWASRESNWEKAFEALIRAAENSGIYVAVNGVVANNNTRKLQVEEFRGFVLADEYAPLVFINGSDAKAAQMFTLAHEIAHIFLGSSASFDLHDLQPSNDALERTCNAVAAEFLVSEIELRAKWLEHSGSPTPYRALARYFKVSEIVIARRALDLGLIARPEFFKFLKNYMAQIKAAKKPGKSGGDFYATQTWRVGRRFGEIVIRAVTEGKLLYSEAFRLTDLHGESFKNFADTRDLPGQRKYKEPSE